MFIKFGIIILAEIWGLSHALDWNHFHKNYRPIAKPHLEIVGGNESIPHAYPYQVGLMIDGVAFCGGSLITKNYVLTAAHCTTAIYSYVDIILGAHNIKTNESTQVHIQGDKIITHNKYNRRSFQNDIALIKLSKPAPLNKYIQTVTLPSKEDANTDYTNAVTTSIGWGLTQDRNNPNIHDISSVLMAVNVSVITFEECSEYNQNDDNITYVTEKNVCTSGYKAKGTCEGDSGSPLIYQQKQIGLVSIGPTQCEGCYPSVFTKVAKFLNWIIANSDVVIN